MKVVGLITEHNPFHNGHLYHLQKAKELAAADGVISVMSGNFLQRGEPALVNKWARAEMALKSGADLVLELPVAFATRSAPAFARGAVEILQKTGVVTHLCFGSERGELEPLKRLAGLFFREPPGLKTLIQRELAKGVVFPLAQSRALEKYLAATGEEDLAPVATSPNNILGIEYLKALEALQSRIIPLTVKRLVAGYHDIEIAPDQVIASATGIRRLMLPSAGRMPPLKGMVHWSGGRTSLAQKKEAPNDTESIQDVARLVPSPSWQILQRELREGRGPIGVENLTLPLLFALRTISPAEIEKIIDVGEGLENRLLQQAQAATSYPELVEKVKTKRYTQTRIQRIFLHLLLGYTKTAAVSFDREGPQYLRVLGFTGQGQKILHHMKKQAALPVILHPAPFARATGPLREMLKLDIRATDLYSLLYPNPAFRQGGQDYRQKPVMV